MGDRTDVNLTIRKADQNKFETICDDFDEIFELDFQPGEVATIEYSFNEVNYGNLDIEQTLQKERIPYTKCWGQGDEYQAGTEYYRIDNNGESLVKEFYEGTEGMVALDDVERGFELNSIDEFIKQMRDEFHIISWKDQDVILSRSNP